MNARTLQRLCTDVPMISDGMLAALLLPPSSTESQLAEHPGIQRMRTQLRPQMRLTDGIAILPVHGVLARRPDPFEMLFGGVEDSAAVLEMIQDAAASPDVRGAVLDIDSPGGFMQGGPEVAAAVRSFGKPTIAHVGGDGASLAYWIASQADGVIANPSASVGSIGVFNAHVDRSSLLQSLGIKVEVFTNKEGDLKAMGLLGTALSEAQREFLRGRAQSGFEQFRAAVLSQRPQVKPEAMRGQSFSGVDAQKAGLVDGLGSLTFATSMLRRRL